MQPSVHRSIRRFEPDQGGIGDAGVVCFLFAVRGDGANKMELHRNLTTHVAVVGVVDDDPAVRNSLKFSLEIEGFAVDVYASAGELLKEKDLSHLICLVVDQHMPGLNGLELVAKLHAQQNAVPVILITTHPSNTLVARAQEAQVSIVEKPLLGNVLVDRIRELIADRRKPGLD